MRAGNQRCLELPAVINGLMRRIAPIDGLTLFSLLGLIGLTLVFGGQLPRGRFLLFGYLLLLGFFLTLKLSSERKSHAGSIRGFVYDFSPILFVFLIYQSLGEVIQHLHPDIDEWLIQMDLFLFGTHPTVWIERWTTPWFTDFMSFAYGSYYFLPVIFIITLYLKNRRMGFDISMFVLTFSYYISFIGYFLFPAIGPRFTLAHLQTVPLEGSLLTDLVRDVLNTLEHNKRDVMPSGHTQISLMVLYLTYRYERMLFYVYVPIISSLILSTVYLRYHYVIDLFVGTLIAVGCMVIGPRLYSRWDRFHKALTPGW